MHNLDILYNDTILATQEQPVQVDAPVRELSVGFVKDENPMGEFVIMTPAAVQSLVDDDIHVCMQHGFSAGSAYSDADYADVGVEFVDDFYLLASMARVLVKFQPFTADQVALMKEDQILFSTQDVALMSREYIEAVNAKRIAALAMNFIEDRKGGSITDRILTETLSVTGMNIALSNFLLPLVTELAANTRLRFALQKRPVLMESVYCYAGQVCHKELADLLGFPYRDIVTLCWDLN
jgi:alanine dehydrogenase